LLYSIGNLTFVALFLQNANFKSRALSAMNTIPVAERSAYTQSIIDFSHHWLFAATGVFFNLSLWAIWLATAAMLFLWNPKERSNDGAQAS